MKRSPSHFIEVTTPLERFLHGLPGRTSAIVNFSSDVCVIVELDMPGKSSRDDGKTYGDGGDDLQGDL
jgi:hypothetical protein